MYDRIARLLLTATFIFGPLACGDAMSEPSRDDAKRPRDTSDIPSAECSAGELNMKRCDLELCYGLNETSVARCGDDGQFGACECVTPGEGCYALDCAAGFWCYAGRCLETKRCRERVCEDGFECWDGSVCGEVFTTSDHTPVSLALGADALIVSQRGEDGTGSRIDRFDLSSGEETTLATDEQPSGALVADADRAYWVSEDGEDAQRISAVALGGGMPEVLLSGVRTDEALTVHDGALYVFGGGKDESHLLRIPGTGGEPRSILQQPMAALAVAIHRDEVYWVNEAHEVWRAGLDGLSPTQLETDARRAHRVVAGERGVLALWTQAEPGLVGTSIYREGSAQVKYLGERDERYAAELVPMAIAVEGDTVYWLFRSLDSSAAMRGETGGYVVLHRTDVRTGETRYIWGTQRLDDRARIAVDARFIYVTNPSRREIVRLINRWGQRARS